MYNNAVLIAIAENSLSSTEALTGARSAVNFNGLGMTTTISCLNRDEMRIKFFTELGLDGNCVVVSAVVKG